MPHRRVGEVHQFDGQMSSCTLNSIRSFEFDEVEEMMASEIEEAEVIGIENGANEGKRLKPIPCREIKDLYIYIGEKYGRRFPLLWHT